MPMSRGYTMHALWNLDLCWPKALYNRGNSVSEGKAIVPMENVKYKTQTILLLNNDMQKKMYCFYVTWSDLLSYTIITVY